MKIIDIINKALQDKTTRFAFEILPPLKGDGVDGTFNVIDSLMQFDPAYINVTNHREEVKYVEREDGMIEKRLVRRRPGTVGISAAIMKRYGVEAVPHLICGGLSKYDIEDELIDMQFLGLENVLALRGDNVKGKNIFSAHDHGHKYACDLVAQIAQMNEGVYADSEVEIAKKSDFCIGVAGYPEKHGEAPNMDEDIKNLKAKVDAGASYIVAQLSYDNSMIFDFIDRCRAAGITVPIIPGIKPFSTKSQLTVLPQVFRINLPADLVAAVTACKDNSQVREVGVEWAIAQARELKEAGIPVLHFYPMGKTDNVQKIARAIF